MTFEFRFVRKLNKVLILFLLSLFFVFHGFVENYDLISVKDAFQLTLFYFLVSGLLLVIFHFLFKALLKAAVFTFCLLAFHFFFGSIHDTLKNLAGDVVITRYSFILVFSFLFFLGLFIYLKRSQGSFSQITRYLVFLLSVLIVIDIGILNFRIIKNSSENLYALPKELVTCDTCSQPDVYLIVPDEYAGTQELKEIFYFDNSGFEDELRKRNFFVVENSLSNYNFTPFSMAAILNLNYLPIRDTNHTMEQVPMVMQMIEKNLITRFFYAHGYTIFNNSVFDLIGEPNQARSSFLPYKTKYITAQTFLNRIERDIGFNLITRFKIGWAIKKSILENKKSNEILLRKTVQTSLKNIRPKFSYTHLQLPHPPYYFDENGRERDYELLFDRSDKDAYLGNLKYANKKLLELIDIILRNSQTPPVIILMSDHGFRFLEGSGLTRYNFMNFCAVLLPRKNYSVFYPGMSAINVFRAVLKTQFNQQIPLLADSTYFLKD